MVIFFPFLFLEVKDSAETLAKFRIWEQPLRSLSVFIPLPFSKELHAIPILLENVRRCVDIMEKLIEQKRTLSWINAWSTIPSELPNLYRRIALVQYVFSRIDNNHKEKNKRRKCPRGYKNQMFFLLGWHPTSSTITVIVSSTIPPFVVRTCTVLTVRTRTNR